MEHQQEIEHLRKRLKKLDDTYHARWPRWTYNDYVSVMKILDQVTRPKGP